jgi:predicted dienelactone hydrolase
VVVSHGSGGAAQQMSWLAEPLADTDFLAVAVDHHGNNFVDGYRPSTRAASQRSSRATLHRRRRRPSIRISSKMCAKSCHRGT